MAMGAPRSNILKLVIQRGLKIVGIGSVIGLVATLALSHLIESMLFGVSAADPISLGASVLVLSLAALLACLLPALRATRINPITSLRE
jgi:putative ABC transport system permease protein